MKKKKIALFMLVLTLYASPVSPNPAPFMPFETKADLSFQEIQI
jgi:hypothetical protein